MRDGIVVPDDLATTLGFVRHWGRWCKELRSERYQKARGLKGLTTAQAITGIHDQCRWCVAMLGSKEPPPRSEKVLSQTEVEKAVADAAARLQTSLSRVKGIRLQKYIPLRGAPWNGLLALRTDCVCDWTAVRLQVYQYHFRRAFYSFDRESGILFPGGASHWVKVHDESVLSQMFPL